MLFLELPNEILWCILHFVPPRDSLVFLKTCKPLYQLKNDELFWREFARHYGIIYLHPNQTWWQLYVSGDLKKTCSHIHSSYRNLNNQIIKQDKCDLFWNTLLLMSANGSGNDSNDNQEQRKNNCCQEQQINGICLYPNCHFKGCGDASFAPEPNPGHLREHYHATGHTLVLKLSSLHFCELFCYACNKPGKQKEKKKKRNYHMLWSVCFLLFFFYYFFFVNTTINYIFFSWILGIPKHG